MNWRGSLPSRFPFRSVWFERGTQGERSLLRVSGYRQFPAMCPRWEIASSDTYGWVALGDSQQLQNQQRRKFEAIDKMAKPPMVGPPSLRNEPASLLPGGITYIADPSGQSFRPAIDVIKPEALDRLDADVTMDAYADITGVPAQTVVPLADARKVRQARTEAQAQQNQLAVAERIAAMGKTASAIDVGGGQNAVSAMLGGGR